jgi:uncharacterized lipoprotein YmbA
MPAARAPRAALLVLLACCPACRILLEPRAEPTHFFTLALPVPSRAGAGSLALGLGPITLPGYLDQSQIVTRLDEERVALAPNDRWAGSLRAQFERALSLRLMSALGTDDVTLFPWWPGRRIDAAVQVTVLAFEADTRGEAHLDALWKVRDGQRGDRLLDTDQITVREPVGAGGTEAAVAALGRALDQLADAIAADVRSAMRGR